MLLELAIFFHFLDASVGSFELFIVVTVGADVTALRSINK